MLSVYIFGATVLVTEVSFLSRIFLGGAIYALHLWKDRSQAVTLVLVRHWPRFIKPEDLTTRIKNEQPYRLSTNVQAVPDQDSPT